MDIQEAERWLDGLINREKQPRVAYSRFGLEAIEALLERVGHPERALSVVHLAGSKGKGSTALFVEALLLALGESVGTYTSPHLERWTERFRLAGAEVGGDALAEMVTLLRPHVDAMRQQDSSLWPSFFDATTAAAFLLFQRAGVDRAVLEVGLGGRLDSTNVVRPAATAVTSIEYEHTDKLGDTLAKIAGEKAGILKPGAACVMGRLPEEAARVVCEQARRLAAPLQRIGHEIEVLPWQSEASGRGGSRAGLRVRFADGFTVEAGLGVPGSHQRDNAAVALGLVRALAAHPDDAIAEAAARALPGVLLPGRIEIVSRRPLVVIDGAHTRESIRALAAWLEGVPASRRRFVLAFSLDKALDPILEILLPLAHELFLTRAEPVRGLDPEQLAEKVRERLRELAPAATVRVLEDAEQAVREAREGLAPDALLCVTGSIYLAGIARRVLVGA